ncbi:GRAM domain-containing protein 2B-like [Varanus komodoensis]|uniref:GRAM domain-containing protein 2B-like n=1 Tax=Varanus komodoensis TaxID=61221 RepID=UPI001CF7D1DB|nr:GRAM domain-containing protein 2B-like [Varanus komodoensis]
MAKLEVAAGHDCFALTQASCMSEGTGKQRKKRTKMAGPRKSQSLEEPVEGAHSRLLFRSKTYDPTFARETEKEAGSSQHRNSVPTVLSPMKHSANFHQVFKDIPEEEELLDTFSCAWQQEVPYHGCLYISHNHVCFHCSMLWREVKVTIPVPTISVLKKANTALLVPNAICIRTAEGDKFLFGSLRSRETTYQLLRSVCKHLQDGSRNSSPTPPCTSSDHLLKISLISKEFDPNNTAPEQHTSSEEPGEAGGSQKQSKAELPETAASRGGRRPTKSSRSRGVLLCPLNTVILIYIFLVVILLLSSGYIGFRIVQLERELISMGAWPELDLQQQ